MGNTWAIRRTSIALGASLLVSSGLLAQSARSLGGRNSIDAEAGRQIDVYVSSAGDDSAGKGTFASPYRTIGRALQEVPSVVSDHYVIHLAPGTYPEDVIIAGRSFRTTAFPNFSTASIQLTGDPASPDDYVIWGTEYAVVCSFANCILSGLSLQQASKVGFLQQGGIAVVHSCTFRDFTSGPSSVALLVDLGGLLQLRGNSSISEVEWGLVAKNGSMVLGLSEASGGDPLRTGLPASSNFSVTGVRSKCGIYLTVHARYEVSGATNISGTNVPRSVGVCVGDDSYYDSETTKVKDFLAGAAVSAWTFSKVEINHLSATNVGTGVDLAWQSSFDSLVADPTFSNVTTPYHLIGGSRATTPTQVLNATSQSLD